MYFCVTSHVLLCDLYRSQTPWLSHLKFPKYYKVFINIKKYKAHARASVLFSLLEIKKTIRKNKGKFRKKLPKCILRASPLFSSRKFPKFKRGLKRNGNEVFMFLSPKFNIKRKTKRAIFVKYPLKSILSPFKQL